MNTSELILEMLERMDRKMDQLDQKIDMKHTELTEKVDHRFSGLTCQDQNLRIDRLEQLEKSRQETRGLVWTALFTGIGAFGLTAWQWIRTMK
jgi:hypothetical protein